MSFGVNVGSMPALRDRHIFQLSSARSSFGARLEEAAPDHCAMIGVSKPAGGGCKIHAMFVVLRISPFDRRESLDRIEQSELGTSQFGDIAGRRFGQRADLSSDCDQQVANKRKDENHSIVMAAIITMTLASYSARDAMCPWVFWNKIQYQSAHVVHCSEDEAPASATPRPSVFRPAGWRAPSSSVALDDARFSSDTRHVPQLESAARCRDRPRHISFSMLIHLNSPRMKRRCPGSEARVPTRVFSARELRMPVTMPDKTQLCCTMSAITCGTIPGNAWSTAGSGR